LIQQGRIGEAFMMDVIDLRNRFGQLYETGIQQAIDYARTLGWIQ
jgi:hypothetical protein